jgi:hypothetical protein
VNVSFGSKYGRDYVADQREMEVQINKLDRQRSLVFWTNKLPRLSPSHQEANYVFKAFALEEASRAFSTLLWFDASIWPTRPLAPLWDLIESQGYWFSLTNIPSHHPPREVWNCGEWTCDSALKPLGITREQAFRIPQVYGGAFGLNLHCLEARMFLAEYVRLARERDAFHGPWINDNREASADPRVKGHRHDQTVASVLAWRLGLKLTLPPKWMVDQMPPTEETVLEVRRR